MGIKIVVRVVLEATKALSSQLPQEEARLWDVVPVPQDGRRAGGCMSE